MQLVKNLHLSRELAVHLQWVPGKSVLSRSWEETLAPRGSWDPGRNCFTLVCPVSHLDMASPHRATRCRCHGADCVSFVSVPQIWQESVDPVNACLSPSVDALEVVIDTESSLQGNIRVGGKEKEIKDMLGA